MNAEFFIPDKDIRQLEKQALSGNSESAKRLIDYYNFINFDLTKVRYWTQIAAENGDVGAYMNLISLMSSNFPPKQAEQQRYDDERLCFWVGKALAAGIKPNQFYMTARKKCNLALKSQ